MTVEVPNLFILSGPGSPSVLADNNAGNVHFAADLIRTAQQGLWIGMGGIPTARYFAPTMAGMIQAELEA